LAVVATIPARRVGMPSEPESRSVMYAVAAAALAPSATPLSTRATISAGSDFHEMNTTAPTAASATAGISTARRRYQSDTCPTNSKLATTPSA
jgi:hypothetical protein